MRSAIGTPTPLLCVLAACAGPTSAPPVTRTDSAGITIVESAAPAWGPEETWRIGEVVLSIGTVDGPPESQLYRVAGVIRLPDGRVLIANRGSSEIRLYGGDGRWIRSLGGEGDGPGELRYLRHIEFYPPDTVIAFDDRGPRVTRYTLDGALVDSRVLASPNAASRPPDHRLPDGRWLDLAFSEEVEGYQQRWNAWVVWNEGDTATDTLLHRPGYEYLLYTRTENGQYRGHGAVVPPFGAQSLEANGPGRVALSDGRAYDIAVAGIDEAGAQMTRTPREFRVRRTVERAPVAQEDVLRFIEEYVGRYPVDRQRQVREQFDHVTAPGLMPTHSRLVFDAGGNLWVENQRLPWDDVSPRIMSVFDSSARWLGDVEVPDGLNIQQIGEDHMAGVETDEMGVEYVRVYRVVKP